MKGYLRGVKGLNVSERKLKRIMPILSPINHSLRHSNSLERRNPPIYSARYFGHKIHMDQNEKLIHYGVTYIMARDGYSGKIVGATIMPRKNNELVYASVYRTAIIDYGLWNQLRVDHGREFYLSLYIQEGLRNGRGDTTIPSYVQTTSTCNHIIERIWVELNQRVTYPLKRIVQRMDESRAISMDCVITKFCVSGVLCQLSEVGMWRMINAWNSHPIPNRGIPNDLQLQASHTIPILPSEIPGVTDAVTMCGHLRDPVSFGTDPLEGDSALCQERNEQWLIKCGMDPDQMFTEIISGNHSILENAILHYIDITFELESS